MISEDINSKEKIKEGSIMREKNSINASLKSTSKRITTTKLLQLHLNICSK